MKVPILNVAGWWDQEDFYGPQKIYETLEKHDSEQQNYFVAGPWNHGGWARRRAETRARSISAATRRRITGRRFSAPWFAYWLKGKGRVQLAGGDGVRDRAQRVGDSMMRGRRSSGVEARRLYFRRGPACRSTRRAGAGSMSYVSDPAHPVPYRPRPVPATIRDRSGRLAGQDQRFVDHRPDVLTWETETLKEDVRVAGDIVAELFASTSGTDSDWVVKLIDVYPDDATEPPGGIELMIADEILRGAVPQ